MPIQVVSHRSNDVRRVLVVEDERVQAEAIRDFLDGYGIEVTCAATVEDARELLRRLPFDVVVLDRMLARRDALGFVAEIHERFDVPVIVASAHGQEVDRIAGLDRGADDYLAKPVSYPELLARIRAVHRRGRGARPQLPPGRTATFGGWTLEVASHRLTDGTGRVVHVSARELAVLLSLLDHPGRVLARRDLLTLTGSDDGAVFDRTVDVLISRLRRKLDETAGHSRIIRTVRAGGYRLAVDVEWR